MIAPAGETWLCAACGNVNEDRYAMPAACCRAYAMRVEKGSIVRGADGRVVDATAATTHKRVWRNQ